MWPHMQFMSAMNNVKYNTNYDIIKNVVNYID